MQRTILQIIYSITIFFLALTGFGQMPIYKRYYLADIPYFKWLSKFYITNAVHYISAIILITIIFYVIFDIILNKKKIQITPSGWAKIIMLFGLLVSGILILIKNFTGTPFSAKFIIAIDLTHIIFCMALLIYSLHTFLTKQKGIMHNF